MAREELPVARRICRRGVGHSAVQIPRRGPCTWRPCAGRVRVRFRARVQVRVRVRVREGEEGAVDHR